ncbi:MAG TPA: hypothetical protein DCY48_03465 [Candidatus Magasanikbacteria bacterium]|nr:hypothetical protein [Candidatus Magasanikbacteria bacterium]
MRNKNYPQEVVIRKLPVKVGLKDFKTYIDPYLSRSRSGPKQKISRCKIFNYILYVLHTGIQWNQLRTYHNEIHWTNVYKWHNRWSRNGSYQNLFETSVKILCERSTLDLSILHGDASNTVAKKGATESGTPGTNIRKD